jgi:outer membrane lipase/esterase
LLPTQLGGTNFAYGGARTDYNVVETRVGGPFPNDLFPWTLSAQVSAFEGAGVFDPNALYIVFSGANDVADMVRNNLDPSVIIPNAVDTIVDAVQAFKSAGARHVVVGNVADLGLTPAFLRPGPLVAALATSRSQDFNELLDARLGTITGLDIIELDVFNFVRDLVADPGSGGFTNVTDPCYSGFVEPNPLGTECSSPDQFLFWDAVHPTTVVHELLAEHLIAQISSPSTLLLATPFVVLLLALRRHGGASA